MSAEQPPQIGEYQNKPYITLNPGAKWEFKFGLAKAKLILQHLTAIQEFVKRFDIKGTDGSDVS